MAVTPAASGFRLSMMIDNYARLCMYCYETGSDAKISCIGAVRPVVDRSGGPMVGDGRSPASRRAPQ